MTSAGDDRYDVISISGSELSDDINFEPDAEPKTKTKPEPKIERVAKVKPEPKPAQAPDIVSPKTSVHDVKDAPKATDAMSPDLHESMKLVTFKRIQEEFFIPWLAKYSSDDNDEANIRLINAYCDAVTELFPECHLTDISENRRYYDKFASMYLEGDPLLRQSMDVRIQNAEATCLKSSFMNMFGTFRHDMYVAT